MCERAWGAAALALTLLAAGCASISSAAADRTVVASFYPLAYVAERVAGDHFTVRDLTPRGAEPHDAELSLRQTALIADAALVVYERGLSGAVDQAVSTTDPARVVDAAEVVGLEKGDDPHVWLDPQHMADVARAVGKQLTEADPAHAADYAMNRDLLVRDLTRLDAAYRAGFTRCRTTTVVVTHDAFGALRRFGLRPVAISGLSPQAEPSPKRLADLRRVAVEEKVTTVFTEPLASPALAEALTGDLHLRTAVLDPIEVLTDDTADEDYLSLMRQNLAALREAGGCS